MRPVKHLVRRALSIRRSGAVVLLYHRVARPASDPQLLAVTPELFSDHLDALKTNFEIVSVGELVQRSMAGGVKTGTVAITFDDGYADNLTFAAPLLVQRSIPATVFVSTGYFDDSQELWWDRLDRLLLKSIWIDSMLSVEIGGKHFTWKISANPETTVDPNWNVTHQAAKGSKELAYLQLHSLMKRLDAENREVVFAQIVANVTARQTDEVETLRLTADQVAELADVVGITVGAHTVSHPSLTSLDIKAQEWEVKTSKTQLESITGRPIDTFSYPFGSKSDFSTDTVELVRKIGFLSAFANIPGYLNRGTDLYQIPRLAARGWKPEELLKRVSLLAKGVY